MSSDKKQAVAKEEWEQTTLRPWLENYGERKETFETMSGYEIRRLYDEDDLEAQDFDYEEDLGYPGEEPFTRGVYPTMHRGRLWTRRQLAGFATPDRTNERMKYLLNEGATGLNTTFDMPTLMGLDSDAAMSEGEVGIEGVAVDTLRDMELLFEDIPVDEVSESLIINSPAAPIMGMYIAMAEDRGVPKKQLRGTTQNDMLKEFHAQNEWILPVRPSVKINMDIVEYTDEHMPKWNPVSISGYHIRDAGATAVQELAFTLADGLAYVEEGVERGMNVDSFVPQLSFFFNAHNSFFEEIAKYRAARRLWAREIKDRYDPNTKEAMKLKFHVQTSGASLTAQQPENNVARITHQAMAAIMGGAQSIHTNGYDEALNLPTEEAMRIALRTQQLLIHESKIADTIDPLGGSYHVESLTSEMEEEAMEYIEYIEESFGDGSLLEGVLNGIDEGYFRSEIQSASYEYNNRVESGEETIVGVNEFTTEGDGERPQKFQLNESEIRRKQVERIEEVKAERDSRAVEDALIELKGAAENGENVMPYVVDAVSEYATEQEVMDSLKAVHGEYQPISTI